MAPRSGVSAESLALAAAGLSFSAALVHGSVIATHFREYWLFGLFFALVTPLQVAWAVLAARRPHDRGLLLAGAAGNLAIAAVWLLSRTTGLPFGPDPWEAEAVGAKDLLATYDEFGVAVLVALLLGGRNVPRWVLVAAWTLVSVSVLAAFLPGH